MPSSVSTNPGRATRMLPTVIALLFVCTLVWLSLVQGLTWDEPWLMGQARTLAHRGVTETFKPLAGAPLLPVFNSPHRWIWGRILFVGIQGAMAWMLWKIMPRGWPRTTRWAALGLLWLEPTFRERVVEMRTDAPAMLLLMLSTFCWFRGTRFGRIGTALLLGLALALAPKTLIWVAPWFLAALWFACREGFGAWKSILGLALGTGICAGLAWLTVAAWTGQSWWGFIHTGYSSNASALTNNGPVSGITFYYLKQTILLGLPFYLLAILGLGDLVWCRDLDASAWGRWELTGLGGALLTLGFSGAFPYHFMGVALGLLPLAMRGLARVGKWIKSLVAVVALALSAAFSLYSIQVVLHGPTLPEQMQVIAFAESFLQPGTTYVDGVGLLEGEGCPPFATGSMVQAGGARGLWKEWEHRRANVFLLNGRTEMFMTDPDNAAWGRTHLVILNPSLAVVGTSGQKGKGPMDLTWVCPFNQDMALTTVPGNRWTLDGNDLSPGQVQQVTQGVHHLHAEGSQEAPFAFITAQKRAHPMVSLNPFFLRFQRL